jgi:hypothetical protein
MEVNLAHLHRRICLNYAPHQNIDIAKWAVNHDSPSASCGGSAIARIAARGYIALAAAENDMVTKSIIGQTFRLGLLLGVSVLLQAGCSKKDSEETITLKGRIEKVRRISDTTGELTVRFFNEKTNKEVIGTALYSPETRIEKNGTPMTVQDLQEGVQVNGQIRSQREGGQRKYKAVVIKIESPTQ